MNQEAN